MNNFLYSELIIGEHKVKKILGLRIKTKLPKKSPLSYIMKITPHVILPNLEVHLTEHCNLNCKGCTHFSTLAEPEFLSLEEYEKDLKRLSELTNQLVRIRLLGGEPLLNPNAVKYTEIARKYFPETRIEFITNGTLLLDQDDSFFEGLSKNNIILAPTKYPIKIDWKKIKEKCEKFDVQLKFFAGEKTLKTSYKYTLDINGNQNARKSFLTCGHSNICIQLVKGKLYTCCMAPYARHFNKYFNQHLELSDRDGIDIYKAQNIQEILNFLAKPIPFCRYCNWRNRIFGMKWGVSSKKIEEWIYVPKKGEETTELK